MGAVLPEGLRIEHDGGADAHFLHAYVPGEPNQIGVIAWSKVHDGQIYEIWTDERYRRRGIATLLWNTAWNGGYRPPIKMSSQQIELGALWVRSLGTDFIPNIWDGNLETYWDS